MAGLVVYPGLKIGKLTILREIDKALIPDHVLLSYRNQGIMYECDCECGQKAYWPEKLLQYAKVKSCGCLRQAQLKRGRDKTQKLKEAKYLRREILKLQKFRALMIAEGKWDFHQKEIGEQLRENISRLRKLGLK